MLGDDRVEAALDRLEVTEVGGVEADVLRSAQPLPGEVQLAGDADDVEAP